MTRKVLIEGEDCEVDADVSWENIGVVENVFVVEVDATTIILRLMIAPSILHKNTMPFLYPNFLYAPFGRSILRNFILHCFFNFVVNYILFKENFT